MAPIDQLAKDRDFPLILVDPDTDKRSVEGHVATSRVAFDDLGSHPKLIVGTDDERGNYYLLEKQTDGTFKVTRSSSGTGLLLGRSLFTGNDFQYGSSHVNDNTGLRTGGFFYVRDGTLNTLTKSFEIRSIHVPNSVAMRQVHHETRRAACHALDA